MRLPIIINIKPYMFDHSFLGNAVLPAVEAMRVIASVVLEKFPGLNVNYIKNAQFAKFLQLTPGEEAIEAAINIIETDDIIIASLITVNKLKSGITRTKDHVVLHFEKQEVHFDEMQFPALTVSGKPYILNKEKIYSELVPFATFYQNAEWVIIDKHAAKAQVEAPIIADYDMTLPLGSPFPLDAAFHAACVWGQRAIGIVGFPVAFSKRVIFQETLPGAVYMAEIFSLRDSGPDLLKFDLALYDFQWKISEAVYGLEMRDVSAGKLLPPVWIVDK